MTTHESGDWLEAVIVGARDAQWCTKPFCTTCGCMEFRRAFWAAAARQAGIDNRFEIGHLPHDIMAGVSEAGRERIILNLVAGVRQMPAKWSDSDAFRTIVIDLDSALIRHGVPIVLDAELSATPAGDGLARMRAHAEWVSAERERREAYESPQAVEERKRAKGEKRESAHALRQSQSRGANARRLELLAALACLSAPERLSRFAMDPALNLD